MVKEITVKEFDELVQKEKLVVDVSATWCGQCKVLRGVLEEVSEELLDYSFYVIHVDDDIEFASSLGVKTLPTLLVYEDGTIKKTITGNYDVDEIINGIV